MSQHLLSSRAAPGGVSGDNLTLTYNVTTSAPSETKIVYVNRAAVTGAVYWSAPGVPRTLCGTTADMHQCDVSQLTFQPAVPQTRAWLPMAFKDDEGKM